MVFDFDKDFELEMSDFGTESVFSLTWDHGYGGTIECIPAFSEGIVYFSCDDYSLYAVDFDTGKEIWRFRSGGCAGNHSPVICDDKVFFGSYDGYLYAIDKRSGKLVWKFKTGGKVVSSAAFSNGRLVFGSRDWNVYCLDMEGREIWRFRTGGQIISTPSILDGMVYIGSYDGCMYCVDLENGKEIWRFRTGGSVGNFAPVNIDAGKVYFGSWDNNMYCVNRFTGKEIWRVRTGGGIMTGGLIKEGILYFGAVDGFYAADVKNGKMLWTRKTEYHLHASSTCFHGNRIYVGGGENDYKRGLIMCTDKDGKILWEFITDGPSWAGPAMLEGSIFAGSWNCYFYRIDPETGKVIWKLKTGSAPSKEKVISKTDVGIITIVTGEGVTIEEKEESVGDRYSEVPEVKIVENVYIGKSEYSAGSETYKADVSYK